MTVEVVHLLSGRSTCREKDRAAGEPCTTTQAQDIRGGISTTKYIIELYNDK